MGLNQPQIQALGEFVDAIQTIAVETGITPVFGSTLHVEVSDGQGNETRVVLEAKESTGDDYSRWFELVDLR